jgi:hypothetical protein
MSLQVLLQLVLPLGPECALVASEGPLVFMLSQSVMLEVFAVW